MTCKDCKFYKNECESHNQMRLIGKERGMGICEIFCKAYVDCLECINFYKCHYSGQLTGRLTSCPDYKPKPKTNAESITATDDELATTLHAVSMGYKPWCDYHCENEGEDGCDNCIKEWLQQPAEGE